MDTQKNWAANPKLHGTATVANCYFFGKKGTHPILRQLTGTLLYAKQIDWLCQHAWPRLCEDFLPLQMKNMVQSD